MSDAVRRVGVSLSQSGRAPHRGFLRSLPTPPTLLSRIRQASRWRHDSPRTEEAYVGWIRRFIVFHGTRHPREMGEPDVTRCLTLRAADRQVSASTQHQALSAILFLYEGVRAAGLPG